MDYPAMADKGVMLWSETRMKRISIPLLLMVFVCAGCSQTLHPDPALFVKPRVAVIKFENRAPFPLEWDLGQGLKEMLVDSLVKTDRFRVIERVEIEAVLRELQFQQRGATRQKGRQAVGRLKNVNYLVKGTITDFGHVMTSRGFLGIPYGSLFGSSQKAVIGMTLQVVDVESGEIVTSTRLEKSVAARDVAVKATYKDVTMGGSVFHRTPLGRAAAKVIDSAVRQITDDIANNKWKPVIAALQDDGRVVLNGGTDRHIQVGRQYQVCRRGRAIIDPETSDVLGHAKGQIVGYVEVVEVHPRFSVAEIRKGRRLDFSAGDICTPKLIPPVATLGKATPQRVQ